MNHNPKPNHTGMGGLPPIDLNLGLVAAARSSLPQTWGRVFILILNFQTFLYEKGQKAFSFRESFVPPLDPHQGLCYWTRGLCPKTPIIALHSTNSPWFATSPPPLWQILDPPLPRKYSIHSHMTV